MSIVQEIRIASPNPLGISIPDGATEGTRITITAELFIDSIEQEWIDITEFGGEPQRLPGKVTMNTVATKVTTTVA